MVQPSQSFFVGWLSLCLKNIQNKIEKMLGFRTVNDCYYGIVVMLTLFGVGK